MQYKQSPSFLAGMLLASVVILIASVVILLEPQAETLRVDSSVLQTVPHTITLTFGSQQFATSSASLMSDQSSAHYARIPSDAERLSAYFFPIETPTVSPFDEHLLSDWLGQIREHVQVASSSPKIVWKNKNQFTIDPGKKGVTLDIEQTKSELLSINPQATSSARMVVTEVGKELSPDGLIESERFIRKLIGKKLTLQKKYVKLTLSTSELVDLLDLPTDFSESKFALLVEKLRPMIETPPIEPKLSIHDRTVESFTAPKDGVAIDEEKFATTLASALRTLADTTSVPPVDIPLTISAPKTSLSATNTLGISERIGIGESAYAHSIPNRIHNVAHTTSKIHAKLIFPGEEFSFNKYLGEVSAATGFKQAYVIKEGQTVLGDGGGVCQVSSTLFRALLDAGLPITERKGHSYRVGYYEQNSRPGFDATVYDPHPDLRFINDTDTAILINAVADSKTTSMYVELWGKSDGRKAEVINYKQWDAQPAPPPRYQDDATLRPGQLKQVDYSAPGLKTSFDYVVTYPNGEKKEKKFSTNYIPWAAVYLRGI